MRVYVNQNDIYGAIPRSSCSCPLAKCLKRKLKLKRGQTLQVGYSRVMIYDKNHLVIRSFKNSRKTREVISGFDTGRRPFMPGHYHLTEVKK